MSIKSSDRGGWWVFVLVQLVLGWFVSFGTAHAVIPPDFVFNIGAQVGQFFSLVALVSMTVIGFFLRFFTGGWHIVRERKALSVSVACALLLCIGGGAFWYGQLQQKLEYEKWLQESRSYGEQNIPHEDVSSPAAVPSTTELTTDQTPPRGTGFFGVHKGDKLFVTNEEFSFATQDTQSGAVVLDARENIEYESGRFPGSLHIRFADLKAGQYMRLPKDVPVYVLCWSGMRGKDVAEFLRSNGIVASYVENGANGWFESGGKWEGDIAFGKRYSEERYRAVFSTEEVRTRAKEGVVLVDTREPETYAKKHIPGSVNIPIMYTPSNDMERAFGQVPPHSTVITVCDGYVNCFDAKLTGVELERRENTFLGRYNKPWEYAR